jgi:hypothetical protein
MAVVDHKIQNENDGDTYHETSQQRPVIPSQLFEAYAMPAPAHLDGCFGPSLVPRQSSRRDFCRHRVSPVVLAHDEEQPTVERSLARYHSEVAAASAAAFGNPMVAVSSDFALGGSIWAAPVDAKTGGGSSGSSPAALYLPMLPSCSTFSLSRDAEHGAADEVQVKNSRPACSDFTAGWEAFRVCSVRV